MKKKAFTNVEFVFILAVVTLLVVIFAPTIFKDARQKAEQRAQDQKAEAGKVVNVPEVYLPQAPTEFGSGIYYFPQADGKEFAKALSYFLSKTNGLEVSSSSPDILRLNRIRGYVDSRGSSGSDSDYGACVGYTVTFREKPHVPLQ